MNEVPKELLVKFIREVKCSDYKTTVIGSYLREISDAVQSDERATFAMSIAMYKAKLFLDPAMIDAFFEKITTFYAATKANAVMAKIISRSMLDEDVNSFSSLCAWHAKDEGSAEWSDRNAHISMSIAQRILSLDYIDIISKHIPVSLNSSLITDNKELNSKIISGSRIESYIPVSSIPGNRYKTINGTLNTLRQLCNYDDYENAIDLFEKILGNKDLVNSNISGMNLSDAIGQMHKTFDSRKQKAEINRVISNSDDNINHMLSVSMDKKSENLRLKDSSRSTLGFNLFFFGAVSSSRTILLNSSESLINKDFLIANEHAFTPLNAHDLGKMYSSSADKSYQGGYEKPTNIAAILLYANKHSIELEWGTPGGDCMYTYNINQFLQWDTAYKKLKKDPESQQFMVNQLEHMIYTAMCILHQKNNNFYGAKNKDDFIQKLEFFVDKKILNTISLYKRLSLETDLGM